MESVLVAGVTAANSEAKLTLLMSADAAGIHTRVFKPLADAGIDL